MDIAEAEGWAVTHDGCIDVRTVSPTRQAAVINAIVTQGGVMVMDDWTHDVIDGVWREVSRQRGLSLIRVVVRAA
jgi:hypothetical protein